MILGGSVWRRAAAVGTMVAASGAWAQSAGVNAGYVPSMTFDVASVRQSPEPGVGSFRVGGSFADRSGSLRVTNFRVQNLLAMAYGVRWDQLAGLPDWNAMFDVQAKADNAADEKLATLSPEQRSMERQHMLQALLAERFHLKAHWETREEPVYRLVVVKGGTKMKQAVGGAPTAEERKTWGDGPMPPLYQRGDSRTGFDFVGHGCTTDKLSEMLSRQFGRTVLDDTQLTGKYDFILHYHGARMSDRSADDLDPVPPLDAAIQEQLGLKLEPARGPTRFLVIDHIEKPSDN